MISVSIVSRYENDRRIITSLLSEHDDFNITSVGTDGYDAIRSAMIHRPNIIIMDFCMNDINSSDLAPIIKRHSPLTKLIVIYSCGHRTLDKFLNAALSAGISGYLLKENGFENLVSSVLVVFYGGLYVGNHIKCHKLNFIGTLELSYQSGKNTLSKSRSNKQYYFSQTELQIINGIALGYKDKEIAKQLNISTGTVRNNVRHAVQKTGLRTRTQVTIYALINGMINSNKICEQFMDRESLLGVAC